MDKWTEGQTDNQVSGGMKRRVDGAREGERSG